MADEKKTDNSLTTILKAIGLFGKSSTNSDVTRSTLGAVLTGAGLIGSLSLLGKKPKVTETIPDLIGKLNAETEAIGTQFEAGLNLNAVNVKAEIAQSAAARGISPEAAKASQGLYEGGLSGAYAAARSALGASKVNAKSKMDTAMGKYYLDMVDLQYKSSMSDYAAKKGLWSSLGGAGVAVMGLEGIETTPATKTTTKSTTGNGKKWTGDNTDYTPVIKVPSMNPTFTTKKDEWNKKR